MIGHAFGAVAAPWYEIEVRRRIGPLSLGVVAGAVAALVGMWPPRTLVTPLTRGLAVAALRAQELGDEAVDGAAQESASMDRPLAVPSGSPTSLGCDEARTIVAQARASLALAPTPIDPAKFADAASDWLDPHGLWSVAPDAPVGSMVRRDAERLLAELEAAPGSGECTAAREIAHELRAWTTELHRLFDAGESEGRGKGRGQHATDEGFHLASSTPFEDGAVTHSAKDLARELGRQAGVIRAAYGERLQPFVDAACSRAAPDLDEDAWSRVVIAAALRAYVPQLDAHGAWAPLDEEISIYDLGLEADPPERLWTDMTRTPVGVRIDHGALPPLADGDVVLKIDDTALAGISVEQAEQLSVIEAAHPGVSTRLSVLRPHGKTPVDLIVEAAQTGSSAGGHEPSSAPAAELGYELVRYGDGRAAIVAIHDVPDDLGPRLEATLDHVKKSARDVRGLLIDLRANGGGSTDGAIAALGLFLPGASLFPMKRRDGGVEIERAPEVSGERQWKGPVAVLVDGDSASAAEMIAGALGAYHRGVIIGDKTYGKGCAQEYLDDDAHAGVLRLTTLLYALPDGAPVQKTGISPNVQLNLPPATEHELSLARALDPWRGPDVREASRVHDLPWPHHAGRIGVCHDPVICRALRALGAQPAAAR